MQFHRRIGQQHPLLSLSDNVVVRLGTVVALFGVIFATATVDAGCVGDYFDLHVLAQQDGHDALEYYSGVDSVAVSSLDECLQLCVEDQLCTTAYLSVGTGGCVKTPFMPHLFVTYEDGCSGPGGPCSPDFLSMDVYVKKEPIPPVAAGTVIRVSQRRSTWAYDEEPFETTKLLRIPLGESRVIGNIGWLYRQDCIDEDGCEVVTGAADDWSYENEHEWCLQRCLSYPNCHSFHVTVLGRNAASTPILYCRLFDSSLGDSKHRTIFFWSIYDSRPVIGTYSVVVRDGPAWPVC